MKAYIEQQNLKSLKIIHRVLGFLDLHIYVSQNFPLHFVISAKVSTVQLVDGHDDAGQTYVGTSPFSDACHLPKCSVNSMCLIAIQDRRPLGVDICARTYEKKKHL